MHIYRKKNQVADKLAKHGATLAHNVPTFEFLEPPPFVMHELTAGQRGTLHKRKTNTTMQLEHPSFCLNLLSNSCNSNYDNTVPISFSDQPTFYNTEPNFASCNVP